MSWQRTPVAAAIVDTLTAATDGTVTAFDHPPATFNIPAFIVGYIDTVTYNTPAFSIDLVTLPVIAAAGIDQPDVVDDLLATALAALTVDPMLGGVVQSIRVVEQRNWRVITVSGADYLAAELSFEIRM